MQFTANYVSHPGATTGYSSYPTVPGSFSGCASNIYNTSWNNSTANLLRLVSFTANAKTYIVSGIPDAVVKLKRVNNANATGDRQILYSEISSGSASACPSSSTISFRAPYNHDMASFLNNNVLNTGTDNLFTNTSNNDGNNNNIERVDVVFPSGVSSALPADAGFVLCERGHNNQHDGFRIAAILSIDASANPTSFGAVKTCVAGNGSNNGSWGHPTLASGNRQLAAYVLRKDPAETHARISSHVNQEIGGVFFSLASLDVAPGQVIYGYALVGPDGSANPSSSQLLNINNASVYPTATTEAQGGGLDLISINSFFGTNMALSHSGLISFDGYMHNRVPELYWELRDLPAGANVSLERSRDAISYHVIHQFKWQPGQDAKRFSDAPIYGEYYYRLRVRKSPGAADIMSRVILLKSVKNDIRIYPNILSAGQALQVELDNEGAYTLHLISLSGQSYFHAAISGSGSIQFARSIPAGIYIVVICREGLIRSREKIVLK
jgi:hypothetical protein